MAQQIKKKYLAPEVISYFDDQIVAVEQALESEVLRAQAEESAIRGEFAQADAALGMRLGAVEMEVTTNIPSQLSGLSAGIMSEASAREMADLALQGAIDTEKGRIDAILSAADADKDTFAEIVQLINSVDTENDTAFGTYVTNNNYRVTVVENDLSAEVVARQNAIANLQIEAENFTNNRLMDYYTKSETDSSFVYVDGQINGILSDIGTLQGRATTLESDVAAHGLTIGDHEARLGTLEGKVDGPFFDNEKIVVGTELSYVELTREVKKIMSCAVGRLAVHEGEDFFVSKVGSVTRITWINSLANPGGEEKIEYGDNIFVVYAY